MRLSLKLNKGQRLFFTSDTHYNHANICKGTSKWPLADNVRDFNTLEEMNDAIVNSINGTVRVNDVLIHLGDWSFGGFESIAKFRYRVHCQNVHLVFGNHDEHIEANRQGVQDLFVTVSDILKLDVKWLKDVPAPNESPFHKVSLQCCHFPIASWEDLGKGRIHLHGHLHTPQQLKVHECRAMDVGMDGHPEFRPYSLEEVLTLLRNNKADNLKLRHDHHRTAR